MRLKIIACKYTVFIQNRNKQSDIFFGKTIETKFLTESTDSNNHQTSTL